MPPRPAPMIVTVVAFAGWFMRGSLQSRLADWSGRLRVGNNLLLAPSSRAELVNRVPVDTFPRESYSSAAQIHRVQFRPGPTDVGMGDGAWRDAPFRRTPDGAFVFSDP